MLTHLSVKNLSIIKDIEIDFHSGLNILTGETGAGKSFIIKAVSLLFGARASSQLVRKGADKTEITALFEIPDNLGSLPEDFPEDATELVIKRVIEPSGKGKCYINGSLVTVGQLQELGLELIEITGQHQQQSLLNIEAHREGLDNFGVSQKILEEVRTAYQSYSNARRLLELTRKEANLEHIRRISFEAEELSDAALQPGEKSELKEKLENLSKLEGVVSDLSEAEAIIDNNFDRPLRDLQRILGNVSFLVTSEYAQKASEFSDMLADLRLELSRAAQSAEIDPAELETIRDRISTISRLERKYALDEEGLVKYLEKISVEIAESERLDIDKLEKKLLEEEKNLSIVCEKLTKERKKVSEKLIEQVESELGAVEMKQARFDIRFEKTGFSSTGNDRVEFLIAPNPGQGFSPLAKSASGGELSRILLVLKTLAKPLPIQIFDEVDTGVGGSAAQKIGEKLFALSNRSQVLVITHSPQVAAFADKHHLLSKKQSLADTVTVHKDLSAAEQEKELARMLAGESVTKEFTSSAKALLQEAASKKRH